MNYYDIFRYAALNSVLNPGTEYYMRLVTRWYSKTYHTPLHIVEEEVPLEDILLAYFEEKYEAMELDEREGVLAELTETDEQRVERLKKEDEEKVSEHIFTQMTATTIQKQDGSELDKAVPKLHKAAAKLTNALKNVGESLKEDMKKDPVEMPEIDIKFVDDQEFEKLINGSGGIKE